MKHIYLFVVTSFCFFIVGFSQSTPEKLVKSCFDSYKTAILNDNGTDAVKFVDSRTIKYYSYILDQVKNTDSAGVDSLSIMDKLMVFMIRLKTSREEILSFNGQTLFAHAVNSGMVGKNSVANNAVGTIVIDKNFAKGQLIIQGKEQPLFFHFYKEEGQWKIDLTALFPMANTAFQNMADESGENTNDYLLSLLEILYGKKPGPRVWQPVK